MQADQSCAIIENKLSAITPLRMTTKLFVAKLTENTGEEELKTMFSMYGVVTSVEMRTGYGFVTYEKSDDAVEAMANLDGQVVNGQAISVEPARPSPRDRMGGAKPVKRFDLRLQVSDVDSRVSWQDLKDWARKAGDVTFTNVYVRDNRTRGVVEFAVRRHHLLLLIAVV